MIVSVCCDSQLVVQLRRVVLEKQRTYVVIQCANCGATWEELDE